MEEVEDGYQDGGGHRGEARLPAKKLQNVFEKVRDRVKKLSRKNLLVAKKS